VVGKTKREREILTIFGSKDICMNIMIISRDNMMVYFLAGLDWPIGTARERALPIGGVDFRNGIASSIKKKWNRSRVFLVSVIVKTFYVVEDLRAVLKATDDQRGHILELRME
jgi:hypothetical protein